MKLCTITSILLLTASVESGYTVLDSLANGFDTVYKYEGFVWFSREKTKFKCHSRDCHIAIDDEIYKNHSFLDYQLNSGHTFNVHTRKTVNDDPNQFIMHLRNFSLYDATMDDYYDYDETLADAEAYELPIIVTVQNENVDEILVTNEETDNSLFWKTLALELLFWELLHDFDVEGFIDQMNNSINSISINMDTSNVQMGNCKEQFTWKKTKHIFVYETKINLDECTGELGNNLLEILEWLDALHFSGGTKIEMVTYVDRETLEFLKITRTMNGGLVRSLVENDFIFKEELTFDSYTKIDYVFDETENVINL